ncbi:MAG: hypothetical protein ACR2L2_15230 [Acidobacteriota bacterium]
MSRRAVWLPLAIFVLAVSCAAACPDPDLIAPASQSCESQKSDSCKQHPADTRCPDCVDTHFVAAAKFPGMAAAALASAIAVGPGLSAATPLALASAPGSSRSLLLKNCILRI